MRIQIWRSIRNSLRVIYETINTPCIRRRICNGYLLTSIASVFGELEIRIVGTPSWNGGENNEIKFGTVYGLRERACHYTYIDPCFRNVRRSCAAEADDVADIVGAPGMATSCLRRPCRVINSSFRLRNDRTIKIRIAKYNHIWLCDCDWCTRAYAQYAGSCMLGNTTWEQLSFFFIRPRELWSRFIRLCSCVLTRGFRFQLNRNGHRRIR